MSKVDYIEYDGVVTKLVPGGRFVVRLSNGHDVLAHLSGKMRLNKINIMLEDTVKVEISSYDLTQGRIIYRNK